MNRPARCRESGRSRFEADRTERERLAERFFDAFRDGHVDALAELLAADVRMIGDSGGRAPRFERVVVGAGHVARTLAAFAPLVVRGGGVVEPRRLNGRPGTIFRDRDGLVLSTWVLDVLDGRIRTIHTVNNPDKLSHIGPVADAWAALPEANQAPRQGNSNR
ncbi:sigma-70 family RNA polymerase sigma factor family protein [Streptomyces niveus]|uniref:hypothetical protein n=1 Tax=Streptomyces niveus TaxID=193462 RepID=UPI00365D81D0